MPGLLFDNKLSGYREEKILIQLDIEAQKFDYKRESVIINKFDILSRIYHTPKNILLSQKLWLFTIVKHISEPLGCYVFGETEFLLEFSLIK